MINATEIISEAVETVFKNASARNKLIVLDKIMKAYNDAARGHHDTLHIAETLFEAKLHNLHLKRDFVAAILYHDIVYEPDRYAPGYMGPSNEAESAHMCREDLYNAGVPGQIINRASDLILLTEKHIAPKQDMEAALFMDMDMSIFGANSERYKAYAQGTAKEFLSVFTPAQYSTGRTQFLKSLSEKQSIFLTPHYKALDVPARENMAWELRYLPMIISPLSLVVNS
jgi:predicted metal-dependent HD superfamily phosphohydrolase